MKSHFLSTLLATLLIMTPMVVTASDASGPVDPVGITIAADLEGPTSVTGWATYLSTQGEGGISGRECVKRGKDCTFNPCCDGRYCRQNNDGDKRCR